MTTLSLQTPNQDWRQQLPNVRGRYSFDALLSGQTWFRVGGPADVLFKPIDIEDLQHFLKHRPLGVPVYMIGTGSNMLVRDKGIRGIVIRLGRGFSTIQRDGYAIEVGAGALDRTVAFTCAQEGIGGLEFLVGIPGSIGGAIRMNAGCYEHEIKDILEWVDLMDLEGNITRLTPNDLNMTYRHTNLTDAHIIIRARLQGYAVDPQESATIVERLLAAREETQPVRGRTGGSTFKNPSHPKKAWQLIDEAGCRGLRIGDAQVSPKHCNFLMNLEEASAKDIENLGNIVKEKVKAHSGIDLSWEIIRLGE